MNPWDESMTSLTSGKMQWSKLEHVLATHNSSEEVPAQ